MICDSHSHMSLVLKMGSMTSQLSVVLILWAKPCNRVLWKYRKSSFVAKKKSNFHLKWQKCRDLHTTLEKLKISMWPHLGELQNRYLGILKIFVFGPFPGGQNWKCCNFWPKIGIWPPKSGPKLEICNTPKWCHILIFSFSSVVDLYIFVILGENWVFFYKGGLPIFSWHHW